MTEAELSYWNALIESAARRLAKKFGRRLSYPDALQHTLVAAWKIKLDKRYSKRRQENYLRQILYWRALSEYRKEFGPDLKDEIPLNDNETVPALERQGEFDAFQDFKTVLEQALASFCVCKRDAVKRTAVMFFIERYSTAEIANELKVSQRTVQRNLGRIRQYFLSVKKEF